MKSLGICYWYVKMPQCGYVEHGSEYFSIDVQKHIAHLELPVLDSPTPTHPHPPTNPAQPHPASLAFVWGLNRT